MHQPDTHPLKTQAFLAEKKKYQTKLFWKSV